MRVTRTSTETMIGPSGWFTGAVYIDNIMWPSADTVLSVHNVHFAPGARTVWHSHPLGQVLFVTEGVGLCQRRGGPIEQIRPGDHVFIEPGEDHWHGAAPDRFMAHFAVANAEADGNFVTWGEPVSNEEYGQAPES